MEAQRNMYKIFIRILERKHLELPKHRWRGKIKVNLKEIGCEGMGWNMLLRIWASDRACEHSRTTSKYMRGREYLD
jgi:hypothetical protein